MKKLSHAQEKPVLHTKSTKIKAYQCHSSFRIPKKHKEVAGSSIRKLWCIAAELQGSTMATFICDLDTAEISGREFLRTAEVTDS